MIPGWASDYRIFGRLDLDFNYLLPVEFSPSLFNGPLLKAMAESDVNSISVFGWSLGGFVAAGFASLNKDLIEEVILVSIRGKYGPDEIAIVKDGIAGDKTAELRRFFIRCFPCRDDMRPFRESLFETYCRELDTEELLSSLEFLERVEICPGHLKGIERVKIIHGSLDRIAPVEEAAAIAAGTRGAKFISMPRAGHMPFLREDFTIQS